MAKPMTASANPPQPRLRTLTVKLSVFLAAALFHGPANEKMAEASSMYKMPLALPLP